MERSLELKALAKINLGLDVLGRRENGYHDVKMIMQGALLANASVIILAHNHPSGNPSPSKADIQITLKVMEAGKIIDIKLLDHIIIGDHSYVSLKEQKLILQNEINEKENKLKILNGLEECLEDSLSEDLIERVNKKVEEMENTKDKKALQKIRGTIIGVGIPLELIEIATFILGLKTGIWWPFAIGMVLVIIGAIFISKFYFTKINYICPECNKVFKPNFKEALWANHTPTTRKLTCPHCKIKSFCVETTREIDAE